MTAPCTVRIISLWRGTGRYGCHPLKCLVDVTTLSRRSWRSLQRFTQENVAVTPLWAETSLSTPQDCCRQTGSFSLPAYEHPLGKGPSTTTRSSLCQCGLSLHRNIPFLPTFVLQRVLKCDDTCTVDQARTNIAANRYEDTLICGYILSFNMWLRALSSHTLLPLAGRSLASRPRTSHCALPYAIHFSYSSIRESQPLSLMANIAFPCDGAYDLLDKCPWRTLPACTSLLTLPSMSVKGA